MLPDEKKQIVTVQVTKAQAEFIETIESIGPAEIHCSILSVLHIAMSGYSEEQGRPTDKALADWEIILQILYKLTPIVADQGGVGKTGHSPVYC